MADIQEVINEILKFSPRVLGLYEGAGEDKINEFEKQHNLALPNDYKVFLRKTNGLCLMGTLVYGIIDPSIAPSLGESYKFEHYEVENEMPMHLVPFSPDGGGNHYCFDAKRCNEQSCEVVFWQHDFAYSEEDTPEVVNPSFAEWAQEVLIDWTLKDCDYDGNDRS